MKITINKSILALTQGDITKQDTDAIVNAANQALRGGGGVDGAIHRAGGPKILQECLKIGGCRTGDAVITTGGSLNAKYVIHTVGPVYRDGFKGEAELLKSAYRRSLEVASSNGIKSISFPSLSTGAFGYPMGDAAQIALTTVIKYLKEHPEIELVQFVLFGDKAYDAYESSLKMLVQDNP
jgi:O-acetyl-ADP-ribose deacetylase (regulator of RNase III)